jgi:hypothetical protein
VPAARSCLVSLKSLDGTTHSITVTAATLFEAAAAAVATFRQEQWAAEALTPNATLRVEVRMPSVVHEVPLKALEKWMNTPSTSPREEMGKRQVR